MMYDLSIILLQASGSAGVQWPSGWTVVSIIVGGIIALVYLFSGTFQNLSSGRKELLEVNEKKLSNLQKEKDEADFLNKELRKQLEKLEQEKNEMEKDKTMLMRDHHQLLEISVADLNTLRNNTKLLEQLEEEVNRYRAEKGLPPHPKTTHSSHEM